MRVETATPDDLATIHAAYADGRRWQREQDSAVWPEFSDEAILEEIAESRLQRVLDDTNQVVGVFTFAYADAAIWGEHERNAHLYLHRIARATNYRGRGLIDTVLQWTHARCKAESREGVRMDTWASNEGLIAYYQQLGFQLFGRRRIPLDANLPTHYHGIELALFEQPTPERETKSS